ncbi:MAG: 30S ribosome-binding factor RbfA [Armatimonadetes bacterium]|nr:30S ribosome-binding factor RbfA [Armatimonadota bacterium]
MATTRQRRVAELLKQEISQILQREVSDPRVGFATVTGVEVTSDLREARVFVSVLGDQQQAEQSLAALQRAAGYVRSLLGRRVDLRVTPTLTFALDRSLELGSRVVDLIEQLEEEEDVGSGTRPAPGAEEEA